MLLNLFVINKNFTTEQQNIGRRRQSQPFIITLDYEHVEKPIVVNISTDSKADPSYINYKIQIYHKDPRYLQNSEVLLNGIAEIIIKGTIFGHNPILLALEEIKRLNYFAMSENILINNIELENNIKSEFDKGRYEENIKVDLSMYSSIMSFEHRAIKNKDRTTTSILKNINTELLEDSMDRTIEEAFPNLPGAEDHGNYENYHIPNNLIIQGVDHD